MRARSLTFSVRGTKGVAVYSLTVDSPLTAQLAPDGNNGAQPEAISVRSRLEYRSEIPEARVCALLTNVMFDFLNLKLNNRGVYIVITRMQLGENLDRFFFVPMGV